MRVAVVGGGLFGCTAALALAEKGHEVHLYEKSPGLFSAASRVNQYRLHAGYHYPRSPETIRECQEGLKSFKRVFGHSVLSSEERYYAIAAKGSKTTPEKYLKVLDEHKLRYRVEKPICKTLSLLIRVKEDYVDPDRLRNECLVRLARAGVEIHLGLEANESLRSVFDKIVVASYAGNNSVLKALGCELETYQYEVCEKPVIALNRISENYRNFSLVVMDGPFCSLDPIGRTGWHVMGHVEHAIHSRNVGHFPEVAWRLEGYLNAGIVSEPKSSKWAKIKKDSKRYMPFLDEALYQGSMFTVRTVLPNKDKTDERPTIVSEVDDQVIRVFSGKLGTAVQACSTIATLVQPSPCKEGHQPLSASRPIARKETTCKRQSQAVSTAPRPQRKRKTRVSARQTG
jgi:hypothetical protein